jgi:ABC-type Na+ efflux pump permease subunit
MMEEAVSIAIALFVSVLILLAAAWTTTRPGTNVTRTGSALAGLVAGFGLWTASGLVFRGNPVPLVLVTLIVVSVLGLLLFLALGQVLSVMGRDPRDARRRNDDEGE